MPPKKTGTSGFASKFACWDSLISESSATDSTGKFVVHPGVFPYPATACTPRCRHESLNHETRSPGRQRNDAHPVAVSAIHKQQRIRENTIRYESDIAQTPPLTRRRRLPTGNDKTIVVFHLQIRPRSIREAATNRFRMRHTKMIRLQSGLDRELPVHLPFHAYWSPRLDIGPDL